MCGIIGYTGEDCAEDVLLRGLHNLEYRGYDSAGISLSSRKGVFTLKCKGRVSALEEKLAKTEHDDGHCGIGHTRWATHGEPSEVNAHPHVSNSLTLVHNGIIENFAVLRKKLEAEGYVFVSDTDTECLAHLLDTNYRLTQDPVLSVTKTVAELKGSYAFGVIFNSLPEEIFAFRKNNPLIVARNGSGFFISSDIPAVLAEKCEVCRVGENEIVHLTANACEMFTLEGTPVSAEFSEVGTCGGDISRDGYESFMLKEMHEQPEALRRVVGHRLGADGLPDFTSDGIPDLFFENADSVTVIGCGSAVHAGLVGKKIIESLAKIPVSVNIASEYRYEPPVSFGKNLTVCISQSGETADTLAALRCAKAEGNTVLGIVNVAESSIACECDYALYTNAGPEIAVATTKGYLTQVAALALIAAKLALSKKSANANYIRNFCKELFSDVPEAVTSVLEKRKIADDLCEKIRNCNDVFFIGRGSDASACTEGSLKLKEISYIHSEAYAAGELKHGTLSLIDCGTPVIACACDPGLFEKTLSNLVEAKSRGAYSVLVCDETFEVPDGVADFTVRLPHTDPLLSPLVTVVFLQCIAYKTAVLRGADVDRPRNLAKSVTVE